MEEKNAGKSSCRVGIESLEDLELIWRSKTGALSWECPFVLPPWLKVWWSIFGRDFKPSIASVRQGETLIGIAPLMLQADTLRFMGDPEICDYFDCIVSRGKESLFFETLLSHFSSKGLKNLEFAHVCPHSAVWNFFLECGPAFQGKFSVERAGVLSRLDLPGSREDYFGSLTGKQRHELRRKRRRLNEAGSVRFRRVGDSKQLPEAVDTFLSLFAKNREDKAAFMTDEMASYFRSLSFILAEEGFLRLFFLDLNDKPVASVFCFDYHDTRYLYNNGYDSAYQDLSLGLMSKIMSIEDAIDEGLKTYSFLRGRELYKYRLGAKEIPLSRFSVKLSQ